MWKCFNCGATNPQRCTCDRIKPSAAVNKLMRNGGLQTAEPLAIVMRDAYNRGIDAALQVIFDCPNDFSPSFRKELYEKVKALKSEQ